jgi:type I restriction-modification system DNA methylase subunit
MAKLLFLPVANRIESSTYSLYDGSCGTGGMLTVAEESLHELAEQHGMQMLSLLLSMSFLEAGEEQEKIKEAFSFF